MNPLLAAFHAPSLLAAYHRHGFDLHFTWSIQAVLALAVGLLILVRPKFLPVAIAVYLIVIGLLGIIRWN